MLWLNINCLLCARSVVSSLSVRQLCQLTERAQPLCQLSVSPISSLWNGMEDRPDEMNVGSHVHLIRPVAPTLRSELCELQNLRRNATAGLNRKVYNVHWQILWHHFVLRIINSATDWVAQTSPSALCVHVKGRLFEHSVCVHLHVQIMHIYTVVDEHYISWCYCVKHVGTSLFLIFYISQGSVATCVSYGGKRDKLFVCCKFFAERNGEIIVKTGQRLAKLWLNNILGVFDSQYIHNSQVGGVSVCRAILWHKCLFRIE